MQSLWCEGVRAPSHGCFAWRGWAPFPGCSLRGTEPQHWGQEGFPHFIGAGLVKEPFQPSGFAWAIAGTWGSVQAASRPRAMLPSAPPGWASPSLQLHFHPSAGTALLKQPRWGGRCRACPAARGCPWLRPEPQRRAGVLSWVPTSVLPALGSCTSLRVVGWLISLRCCVLASLSCRDRRGCAPSLPGHRLSPWPWGTPRCSSVPAVRGAELCHRLQHCSTGSAGTSGRT